MYYSITYPYPSGKSLDLTGFVTLWLREIILLAFVVLGLFVVVVARFVAIIRHLRAKGSRHP
ncbi:MAG: hypothetical protein EPO06_07160 [Burkholderiaceae bacterium]|nr:MAG: hypothetical protein EPO06_07160 [Burkholderiaceae bacterium]